MTLLEHASWSQSLAFVLISVLLVCGLLALLAAIKRWTDKYDRYVPGDRIDTAYTTRQFYTPPTIRRRQDLRN